MSFLSDSTSSRKHFRVSSSRNTLPDISFSMLCTPVSLLSLNCVVTKPLCYHTRAVMADEESEFERPRKIPKTLKEKDSGKRLIVILEKASLETVKVRTKH